MVLLDNVFPKKPWVKRSVDGLPLYQAGTMSWMPGLVQAFTTRVGGCSARPYDSLNLSNRVGDADQAVSSNWQRLTGSLALQNWPLVFADQCHGAEVARVDHPVAEPVAGVDAIMTDMPGLALALFFADCVPIFVYDPQHRAIALIHSGWRGTVKNIVRNTIVAMSREYGTDPSSCLVAIGPCISGEKYEVGRDIADTFHHLIAGFDSGAMMALTLKNEFRATYFLNLRQVVYSQLLAAGINGGSIAVCDACTFTNKRDFFSHRRETSTGGTATGRMVGILGLKERKRR